MLCDDTAGKDWHNVMHSDDTAGEDWHNVMHSDDIMITEPR